MENQIFELQYAMDTFYFLVCGALVMWMAAGFAMLEAGLVRSKNTTEILTKNVALFAIASTMYLVCGYQFMYDGGYFLSGVTTVAQMDDAAIAQVLLDSAEEGFDGGSVYSGASDFFFQVVFVATAMSIVSGAVAERMKLWAFLAFAVVMTGFIYPIEGGWTWGGKDVPFIGALAIATMRARASFTLRVLQQPLLVSCSSARAAENTMLRRVQRKRFPAQTYRWQRSAHSFSGWAGSDLTVAQRSSLAA